MAEEVGHEVVLEVDPVGSSSWTEIDGVTSCSIGRNRDMLDITSFKDTSGARKRLAGLKDGTIQISGNLILADAGQTEIRARYNDGADLEFGFKWDGSSGTRQTVACKVESYEESATVDGLVEFSATLQFNDVIS